VQALEPAQRVEGVPEDLNALCMALLRIDPAERPTSREVLERLGVTVPERRKARTPVAEALAPFVGRTGEMEVLASALEESAGGACVTLVIQGESGVGKSALVRRFLETPEVRAREPLVLEGRCHERESVPYKAFDGVIDALTRYLGEASFEEVQLLLPPRAWLLSQVFPVLDQVQAFATLTRVEREEEQEEEQEAQAQRSQFFSAMRGLIQRLTRVRSLVLVLDDLQWADADSFALLREVLRPPESPAVLLVATVRASPDAAWWPPGQEPDALGPGVHHLFLTPLPEGEARELVDLLLPAHASRTEGSAEWIAAEARGHPLFIQELTRQMAGPRSGAGAPLTLDDALWERVQQLPVDARGLLALVAVAGTPLPNEVLVRASGLSSDAYARAVRVLRQTQLLRTRGLRRQDAIEAFHHRISETLLARLAPEETRERHCRLAGALEESTGVDPELLATHWQGAGDAEKALGHALLAAAKADAALAFQHAARLYELCLALLPDIPTERTARRELLVRLAAALASAGRGKLAAERSLEAAALASPEDALDLRRLAAERYLFSGHLQEGLDTLEVGLAQLGISMPRSTVATALRYAVNRARLGMRRLHVAERPEAEQPRVDLQRMDLAWAVAKGMSLMEPLTAAAFASEHLRLALGAGEARRIARALALDTSFRAGFSSRRVLQELWQEAEEAAVRAGDPHTLAAVRLMEAVSRYSNAAPLAEALASAQEAERLSEAVVDATWETNVARIMGNGVLYLLGRWAELRRRVDEHLQSAIERGDVLAGTHAAVGVPTFLLLTQGRDQRAEEQVRIWMERWPRYRFFNVHFLEVAALVQVDLFRKQPHRALERLQASWSGLRRSFHLQIPNARHPIHDGRARAALQLASLTSGPERRRALARAREDEFVVRRSAWPWSEAHGDLYQAAQLQLTGRTEEALGRLERSEAGYRAEGMVMLAALARYRRGQLLGGSSGAALQSSVTPFFAEHGVTDLASTLDIYTPGLAP